MTFRGAPALAIAACLVNHWVQCVPLDPWARRARRWQGVLHVLEAELGVDRFADIGIDSLRRGVLTLEVAEPAEAHLYQVRYSMRLCEALQRSLPEAGIVRVRFRYRCSPGARVQTWNR